MKAKNTERKIKFLLFVITAKSMLGIFLWQVLEFIDSKTNFIESFVEQIDIVSPLFCSYAFTMSFMLVFACLFLLNINSHGVMAYYKENGGMGSFIIWVSVTYFTLLILFLISIYSTGTLMTIQIALTLLASLQILSVFVIVYNIHNAINRPRNS